MAPQWRWAASEAGGAGELRADVRPLAELWRRNISSAAPAERPA